MGDINFAGGTRIGGTVFTDTFNGENRHSAWQDIIVGNVNDDGRPDFFIASIIGEGETPTPITILTSNADGTYSDSSSALFGGSVPSMIYAARIIGEDFNGDGKADIFVPEYGLHDRIEGGVNRLFLSNANGYEDKTATLPQDVNQTHGASAGDIDNDGDIDILVNNLHASDGYAAQLLVNNGAGAFSADQSRVPDAFSSTGYNAGHTWSGLVDVNNDGFRDMILGAWTETSETSLYFNDGTGNFSQSVRQTIPLPDLVAPSVLDAEEFDLNGDAFMDLIIANTNSSSDNSAFYTVNNIQFLQNDGTGQFIDVSEKHLPGGLPQPGSWIKFIDVVDINNDGFLDLTLTGAGPAFDGSAATSYVLQNNSDNTFSQIASYKDWAVVRPAQLDGDANQEFVYTKYDGLYIVDNSFAGVTDIKPITQDASLMSTVDNGVYRFFNTETGTHFYSNNLTERNQVIENLTQYRYEGALFKAAGQDTDLIDVFRFFNAATGSHFYTSSEQEVTDIQASLPTMVYEGVDYRAYGSESPGSVALHRFFNTDSGTHFYTASNDEKTAIQSTLAHMTYEGVAYWVDPV